MFQLFDQCRTGRPVIASLIAVVAATLALPGLAAAGPTPPPASDRSLPALVISAPVVDIYLGSEDLHGAAAVEHTQAGLRVRLDSTVLFDKDSAALRPRAGRQLDRVGVELGAGGKGALTIIGYTDDLGTKAHGLQLSRRRAAAVGHYLRDRLPSTIRITTLGRGEADPAVPNTSETNRRKNRRVVVVLSDR